MNDYNNNPGEAAEWRAKIERDLAELRRTVCGELPVQSGVVSVEDRLGILERQMVTASLAQDQDQTIQSPDAGPEIQDLALVDIEWGIPKTDPSSDPTATITLRPCTEAGVEYTNADDVVVYVRSDRAAVQIEQRGWKATVPAAGEDPEEIGTILSFQRFPWDVGSPAVHGVLIGEGEPDKVRVSVADTTPGFLRYTADDQQGHHKIIGDSEADISCSTPTGYWIDCEVIDDGDGEKQLKIKHVGPGPSCYTWSNSCVAVGGDIDEYGHVRYLSYYDSESTLTCVGPCA